MQLNDRITVTVERVTCRDCGEWSARDLLQGRVRPCRHAALEDLASTLEALARIHRRSTKPEKRVLREIESRHLNGIYKLHLLTDGSISCQCLSFLMNRGAGTSAPSSSLRFASCKHIREAMGDPLVTRALAGEGFRPIQPPSTWQRICLGAMGVVPQGSLTNDQAYVVIEELLAKQGVDYREVERLIRRHGTFTILPIYAFGVEFEGVNCVPHDLAQALSAAGLPTEAQGYNHEDQAIFKIVHDGSIQGPRPFELVTPKLFGADGFAKLRTLCRTVTRLGGQVNSTTGLHVHVDAWNFTLGELRRLVEVWRKIEVPVVHRLLPPSRRNNMYAREVDERLVQAVERMRSLGELSNLDRYYSLNLSAYARHKTFEFRAHSGSFNADKVTSWVTFVLMLSGAVKAGLGSESVTPTWDGVAEAIGLATGTSVIRRAHRFLAERTRLFTTDAEAAA